MHKLMPRRAGTNKRLSHKLMHPLPLLVWVWPITKLLNGSPPCGFHVTVNVITKPTCEASGCASLNKLKPVAMRMRRPRCYGQASWLLRLNIIHAT